MTRQKISHILLHAVEFDEAAAFTLQMIEHGRQSLELRSTSELIRTVIDILQVRWTLQVLVQMLLGCELAMAEVAFVSVPVPGILG